MSFRAAEFEEKEYEAPLYNQVEQGNPLVWSPGQVLERRLGFDRAAMVATSALWAIHAVTSVPMGLVLSRNLWFTNGFMPPGKAAPSFKLNLFIQAKRPQYGETPTDVATLGVAAMCWRFSLTSHQQSTLERFSAKVGNRALVVYAAPVFHTRPDLYKNTEAGSLVPASTFPSASSLAGHEAWYYDTGGAEGVANPPERVSEASLEERIGQLVRSNGGDDDAIGVTENLLSLAAGVDEAVRDRGIAPNASRSRYIDALRELNRRAPNLSGAETAFARLAIFASTFRVQWHVLG